MSRSAALRSPGSVRKQQLQQPQLQEQQHHQQQQHQQHQQQQQQHQQHQALIKTSYQPTPSYPHATTNTNLRGANGLRTILSSPSSLLSSKTQQSPPQLNSSSSSSQFRNGGHSLSGESPSKEGVNGVSREETKEWVNGVKREETAKSVSSQNGKSICQLVAPLASSEVSLSSRHF